VRIERVVLEHHRDVAVARRHLVHHALADAQLAVADVLEPGDHAQRVDLPQPDGPTSTMNSPSACDRARRCQYRGVATGKEEDVMKIETQSTRPAPAQLSERWRGRWSRPSHCCRWAARRSVRTASRPSGGIALGGRLHADRRGAGGQVQQAPRTSSRWLPFNKGNYEETAAAMVAAYRVNEHPALVQTSERAFLTMWNSGAIMPVPRTDGAAGLRDRLGELRSAGGRLLPRSTASRLPCPSTARRRSSGTTAITSRPPASRSPPRPGRKFEKQLYAIKEKGVSECPMVLANDFVWSLIENYSAIHDQQFGTKANGFGGLDTEFTFNKSPVILGQLTRLKKWMDDGVLQLAGQGLNPEQVFISGKCATLIASTAAHAGVERWRQIRLERHVPCRTKKASTPKNSTIGGGTLWVLKNKSDEEYEGDRRVPELRR
jgi:hypothetical protein